MSSEIGKKMKTEPLTTGRLVTSDVIQSLEVDIIIMD